MREIDFWVNEFKSRGGVVTSLCTTAGFKTYTILKSGEDTLRIYFIKLTGEVTGITAHSSYGIMNVDSTFAELKAMYREYNINIILNDK